MAGPSLTGNSLAIWTGGAIILFYAAQTALGIPHLALGAELTLDYHDRSRVFGARMILEFTGVILAASSLVLLERASDQRTIATELAIAGAVLTMGLVLLTATRIRERPEYQGRGATGSYGAFRDVLRNPHARLLVVVFLLDQLGFSALITLLPYTSQYILQETGMTGIFVGASIVSALVAYPIWFPLARRYGKRNPWIVATVIKAGAFGCMFFLQPGSWELIIALIVVIGAVQGAGNILGPSIKADVVDYDEYQTGERKEGSYFAIWNVATKAAAGVAIALTGFVLSAAGFQPNVEQSETTLLSMRLLFSAFPCLLNLTTALLLLRFSLNEREHARIRAALDARTATHRTWTNASRTSETRVRSNAEGVLCKYRVPSLRAWRHWCQRLAATPHVVVGGCALSSEGVCILGFRPDLHRVQPWRPGSKRGKIRRPRGAQEGNEAACRARAAARAAPPFS